MKTFHQFQESVASAVIKRGVNIPALMTGIGAAGMIMQSKKGKVPKDSEGMPDPLAKLGRKARVKIKKGVRDLAKEIKGGVKQVKAGLSAGQEVPKMGAKGRFSNPNAKLVRDIMKDKAKKGDSYAQRFMKNMKDKRAKNKKIDDNLAK